MFSSIIVFITFIKSRKKSCTYIFLFKLNRIQVIRTSVDLILDAAQLLDNDEERHYNIVTWNTLVNPVQKLDHLASLRAYQMAMGTTEYEM